MFLYQKQVQRNKLMMIGSIGGYGSDAIYGFSPLSRDSQSNIDDPIKGTTKNSECQTCKNRKYVDGSDEMVSFKSPTKISPSAVGASVMGHEREHVANAYNKAATNDGKVLQASIALKTAICPECGKAFIAGGTTTTKIAYPKDNPYADNMKSAQRDALVGANLDAAV